MAHRLALEECERLLHFKSAGLTQAEMARQLKRHPSTIARELSRNGRGQDYWPIAAQRKAHDRRFNRLLVVKMDQPEINEVVRRGLAQYWFPEQIAGRARKKGSSESSVLLPMMDPVNKIQPQGREMHCWP